MIFSLKVKNICAFGRSFGRMFVFFKLVTVNVLEEQGLFWKKLLLSGLGCAPAQTLILKLIVWWSLFKGKIWRPLVKQTPVTRVWTRTNCRSNSVRNWLRWKKVCASFFCFFFPSFFVTAYGWRVCTCVRNRCVSSTPDIAFAPSGRTGEAHLSHGCWGEAHRWAGSAAPGHQLHAWGGSSAGEAALFVRGSDCHGNQGQSGPEKNPGRNLSVHHLQVSLLWEEQERMAEQHKAQLISERMLRQSPPGERRGQEGQLLDAGPRLWGHVWEGKLSAAEEGEENLQTPQCPLHDRESGGVSGASIPLPAAGLYD